MTTWPRRDAICLDCRTLQPTAAVCLAGPRHRVVALRDGAGRGALLTRVWGDPSVRARLRTAAKVGGTGGGVGGALDVCSGCDGCGAVDGLGSLGEVLAVIAVVATIFIAVYALGLAVRALWRRWRRPAPVRPLGADLAGVELGPATGQVGRVVARATAAAAIGDASCAAFGLEARHRARWHGDRVVLRDGATVGFEVVLDDGALVTIPPGPIVVAHTDAGLTAVGPTFAAYLDEIDPRRRTDNDLDPFAATHARQALVRDGDRVELRGPLRTMPGAADQGPAYRGVAATRLAPVGVPRVVVRER